MATLGYLTAVSYGSAALSGTPTYTAMTNILNVSGPNVEVDDIDTTVCDSTSPDYFRLFEAGLADGGELTIEFVYAKALLSTLYGLIRTMRAYKLVFGDSGNWLSDGYIKSITHENPVDDKITYTVTIKFTGKGTFATS